MSEKKISLILCYARSGGTLLNKYLASIKNLVVLSESHPIHDKKGGIFSIKNQAKNWYGIKISSDEYFQQIIDIKKWCDENNKHLILRDWSYIDFNKSYLNNNLPLMASKNISLLKENNIEFNKIGFIRDGIDVYLSQDKNIKIFSKQYFKFLKYLKNNKIKVFKFEDFLINPSEQISKILKELNIDSKFNLDDVDFRRASRNVVGDTVFSRGNILGHTKQLKRRHVWWFKKHNINREIDLIDANSLFDYPTNYNSKETETLIEYSIFLLKLFLNYFRRIKQKLLN